MSDTPKDDSWWQGVDGKWYPPVAKAAPADGSSALNTSIGTSSAKSGRKKLVVVLVALFAVLGALIFWSQREPSTENVTGKFTLVGSDFGGTWNLDEDCEGRGGYSDIGSSTQVVVENQTGVILARTTLGIFAQFQSNVGRSCTWSFSLDIPKGEEFYVLSVGSRGDMVYSFEDLKFVSLTLGDN